MPRTSEPLYLLTGDYPARLERLERAAQAAINDKTPRTAIEAHPYAELQGEFNALRAEAEEAAEAADLKIVFKSLGRQVWRQLKVKHPPRTSDSADEGTVKGDRFLGINVEAMQDDLVHASIITPARVACAEDQRIETEPCGDDNPCSNRRQFNAWADTLGNGEWNVVAHEALEYATGAALAPKELPPLPTTNEG